MTHPFDAYGIDRAALELEVYAQLEQRRRRARARARGRVQRFHVDERYRAMRENFAWAQRSEAAVRAARRA